MDLLRHQAAGSSAELVGKALLSADIQLRTFGLLRSAAASLPTYSAETCALLDAYAQGVDGWLQDPATKLSAESRRGTQECVARVRAPLVRYSGTTS